MEHKKNPKLDTTRLSNLLFTGGLVITLSITIFVFEYKTYDENVVVVVGNNLKIKDNDIIIYEVSDFVPSSAIPAQLAEENPIFKPSKEEIPDTIRIKDDTKRNMAVIPRFEPPVAPKYDEIQDYVAQKAIFSGGNSAYITFLNDNLKYPAVSLLSRIEGTVYVSFVVDKDGSIMQDCVRVVKPVNPELDAEVIRVVKIFPNWTPALQNEQPIRQRLKVPVKFRIAK